MLISLWKQKMQHLENGHEQITYLLNLNEKAYDHGDNDVVSHREVVVKLCQLRKIIAEQQLYLTNKKEDITSLKAEMILVPKEQHKEMATLLLSSFTDHFIDQKYCENVGKKLKLQVLNRLGHKVSWKCHLAAEYQGSYRPVESETAVILD